MLVSNEYLLSLCIFYLIYWKRYSSTEEIGHAIKYINSKLRESVTK